ncbi:MAG: hypothetical protein QOC92_593 [Acidimicrobiaceae bacterium]
MTDVVIESPRHTLIRRVLTTLVIAACVVGLAVAVQHTQRGDKDEPKFTGQASKSVIELQAPAPESSVLSQAQLLIDLTTSYDASFVVNGVLIPDDQLQKRPELNQVIFSPGPGKVIEKFPAGRNCVEANIFRLDGVQEDVPAARWCFNVT